MTKNIQSFLKNQTKKTSLPKTRPEDGKPARDSVVACLKRTRVSRIPLVVISGIDTLEITFKSNFQSQSFITRLREAKMEMQKSNQQSVYFEFLPGRDFMSWELSRVGNKLYSYILRSGDVFLMISPRKQDSKIPNTLLKIGSVSCNNGYQNLIDQLYRWFGYMGINTREEKIARVDMFADLKCNIVESDIDDHRKIISLARDFAKYSRNWVTTGVQLGRGDIVLRIYNKVKEMLSKADLEKYEFFLDLWKEKHGVQITRVEFQLRAQVLREFKIRNLIEFRKFKGQLWEYLTTKWVRFTEKPVDRGNKNQKQAKTSYFWKSVENISGKTVDAIRRIRDKKFIHYKMLTDQMRGIAISLVSSLGIMPDVKAIIEESAHLLKQSIVNFAMEDEERFIKLYSKKMAHSRVMF
jgi:hypothetical protein